MSKNDRDDGAATAQARHTKSLTRLLKLSRGHQSSARNSTTSARCVQVTMASHAKKTCDVSDGQFSAGMSSMALMAGVEQASMTGCDEPAEPLPVVKTRHRRRPRGSESRPVFTAAASDCVQCQINQTDCS